MGKIRIRSLVLISVIFCIMLENLFYAIPILSPLGAMYEFMPFVYVFLALACYFSGHIRKTISPYCKKINKFLLIIFLLVFIESMYTIAFGGITFEEVMVSSESYLKLLLVYPIIYILCMYGENRTNLYISVILCTMICYCAYIAIVFNQTGVNLNQMLIYNEHRLRGGTIRIQSIALLWFAIPICFNEFLHTKQKVNKIFFGSVSLGSLCYFIYINQSRSHYIALIAMMIVMYFCKERRSKRQLLLVIIGAICAVGVFNSQFFQEFLFTFSTSYSESTTTERIVIIADLNNAVRRMPLGYLFGMGIRNTAEINGVVRWFMDIGLLGDFFNTGILSLVLFGYMVTRLLKNAKILKVINNKDRTFLLGIAAYLLAGIPGYTVLPYTRIFSIPFIVAYCEYLGMKVYRLEECTDDNQK